MKCEDCGKEIEGMRLCLKCDECSGFTKEMREKQKKALNRWVEEQRRKNDISKL